DALIGCDIVVSSSPKASITYKHKHTRALVNTAEMLTGDFIRNRDASLRGSDRVAAIAAAVGADNLTTIDANRLANKLMGDTIYANVLLLGCAWQAGLVPVSLAALLRAIELNGVKIEANKQAFTWGRIAAVNLQAINGIVDVGEDRLAETLDGMIARRREFLVDYQGEKLAQRYIALVEKTRAAESTVPGSTELTEAVARSYFKLLSYKDEYEVARLHTGKGFLKSIRQDFGSKAKLRFHLAPPILNAGVDARGRPRKKEFGAWILPVFRVLAKMRRLRGTAFDLFGKTAERRMERALIREFETMLDEVLPVLTADTIAQASSLFRLWLDIRGYGPVKEASVREVRAQLEMELGNWLTVNQRAA
ncbi:MAG: pyruvate ferredoxin oxidoreductase, partial [Gammaproteobacteria bacterium]|nr:pyruvate ferredoxin oxidoreductase [Gammaproteobacteria bacterium]